MTSAMATASQTSVTDICPKHNNKYIAYCQQHQASICIDCLLDDHTQCITETINVSNAMETAISTSEEYSTRLGKLTAEFMMKLKEKKTSLRKLERLEETMKDGIHSFKMKVIQKINTTSGEAFELATSVLSEQRLLAAKDINNLDQLTTKLHALQKSINTSFNRRLSGMMKGLNSTDKKIQRIEDEYDRINTDIGNVRVQFIINPMIPDFLENFNSLGELCVENKKANRKSTCLYQSPSDISRPYRRSTIESDDTVTCSEKEDDVFVYKERPFKRQIMDDYIRIDDSLFTDTATSSKHCSPPPTVPRDAPDGFVRFDQKTAPPIVPRVIHTDTRTQTNVLAGLATSMFYVEPTSHNSNSNSASHASMKSDAQNTKSDVNEYRIETSISRDEEKTDGSDMNQVVMRPKTKLRRGTSLELQSAENKNTTTIVNRPIPAIPKYKFTTSRDVKGPANDVRNTDLQNRVPNPRSTDAVPKCHIFPSRQSNATDSGVIVESREISGYGTSSTSSSPRYVRRVTPMNSQVVRSISEDVNSAVSASKSVSDIRYAAEREYKSATLPKDCGASHLHGLQESLVDDCTEQLTQHDTTNFGTVETRIKAIEQRNKVNGLGNVNPVENNKVNTHVQMRHPPGDESIKTDERRFQSRNGNGCVRQSGFRVPLDGGVTGNACLVTGITITATGEVVLCLYNQDEMQLYDSDGALRYVQTIVKPYGACSVWGNRVAITSRDINSICIFESAGMKLKCIQKETYDNRDTYGIDYSIGYFCVSSLDKVLILTESLQLFTTVKCTITGLGIMHWPFRRPGKIEFSDVQYAAIYRTAEALLIYVSDYRKERVACIDTAGRVKWTHVLPCPTCIQICGDNLYVATKKRIAVLCARTGTWIRDITDGVPKRPWALVVDTMTSGLLVSNRSRSAARAKLISHVSLRVNMGQSTDELVI